MSSLGSRVLPLQNVELLQQNVFLRDENVQLKQIILEERKQAYDAIQFQMMETHQKDQEILRLQELLKNEGVLNNLLRDLLLQSSPSTSKADGSLKESPSKNIDDEDYHGSGENSSSTGQETPVTDFSDSGVSENEMLQVNMNDELEGLTLIL